MESQRCLTSVTSLPSTPPLDGEVFSSLFEWRRVALPGVPEVPGRLKKNEERIAYLCLLLYFSPCHALYTTYSMLYASLAL